MTEDQLIDEIIKLTPKNGDIIVIRVEPEKIPSVIELITKVSPHIATGVLCPVVFLQPHESIELIGDEEAECLLQLLLKRRNANT